jgi:hypothetical protein
MTRWAYVAGPMRGYRNDNAEMFQSAREYVDGHKGWQAFVPTDIEPHDHSGQCPGRHLPGNEGKPHTEACYFRGDIEEMLHSADVVVFLPGWELSVGARLEHMVAAMCGLPIYYWNNVSYTAHDSRGVSFG